MMCDRKRLESTYYRLSSRSKYDKDYAVESD